MPCPSTEAKAVESDPFGRSTPRGTIQGDFCVYLARSQTVYLAKDRPSGATG